MNTHWLLIPSAATLLGCASVQPTEVRRDVGELVEGRLGMPAAIPEEQDAESRARVRARVLPHRVDRAERFGVVQRRRARWVVERNRRQVGITVLARQEGAV